MAASCTSPRVALTEPGWGQPEAMRVKGRNSIFVRQKMSFGEYYTSNVKRSWVKGNSGNFSIGKDEGSADFRNIIGFEYINRRQTMNFSMNNGSGASSDVYAVTKFKSRDLVFGDTRTWKNISIDLKRLNGDKDGNLFYVQVYTNGDTRPWQMVVDNDATQRHPRKYTGRIARDEEEYFLKPITKMENGRSAPASVPFGALGYSFFRADGTPVAAVSMMENGEVYFGRQATEEEKFLMANACAAILLQKQISK